MKWLPLVAFAGLIACGLIACGDGFQAAQEADSIEAYEAYLQANPEGRFSLQANSRLESLYLETAAQEKSLEAYDRYLERFPEGALHEKGLNERESFLFAWANEQNTAASWQRFLDEYPKGKKERKQKARRLIKVHEYLEHLDVSEAEMSQVNLAEDPEGPLDGWGFQVMVTNNGPKTIETMHLTIEYLGDEGVVLGQREWGLVAPFWPTPIEEERKVPMKPGDTRPWDWTTGSMPDGWAKRVRVYPSRIAFLEPGKKK
jgi:hypothetical protein